MPRQLLAFATISIIFAMPSLIGAQPADTEPIHVGAADWPWWRGPNRNGVADPNQKPPLRWNETDNVLWKAPVPGRGYGSPIVVGDKVFLATADHERMRQDVLCFHRQTGKLLWQTEIHKGHFETKGNKKSTLASSTPACDGRRVFVNFLHDGAIYTTALSLDGAKLWQTKVTDFVIHQGFGSSPALYQSLVIVSGDHKGGGAIVALDRITGKVVWKDERPSSANYTSPIILHVAGRDQIILTGCDLVTGLDPLTGKKLWEIPGSTTECVTSTITDGRLIFTSGGYPKNHVSAVRADGSGQVVWEKKTRVYVPSLLVEGNHIYGVLDDGIAVCWKCDTGKEIWRNDLGGTFSASPILVGDHVFATNEAGQTFIFKATPEGFFPIAENHLGGEVLATPVICGGRIYMRVAVNQNGRRQEMLYCLGERQ
jgi:outer membrane protein assembly factor BamB